MIKNITTIILIALLLSVPVSYFFGEQEAKLMDEGRKATAFPKLPSRLSGHKLQDFFSSLDMFYADNFPLRSAVIELTTPIRNLGKSDLNPNKCYRGLQNWLFLGNDYVNCVDKLEGNEPLPPKKLETAINRYSSIAQKCTDAGSQFAIVIGPNKSTIYPEFLPPTVIPAKKRYLTPLVDALQAKGITVYDPTEDLLNAKKENLLYWRTNTHWNAYGGFVAFEGIRKLFHLPKLNVSFVDGPLHRGDLINIGGYKKGEFPLLPKDNFDIILDKEPLLTRAGETFTWPNHPENQREKGLIKNSTATAKQSIWIFTDSFSAALVPYIVATFQESTFFQHKKFDEIMNSQEPKPDIILWVRVERSFI